MANRRECVLCGKKADGVPYPYSDSNAVMMGEEAAIMEYYLCDHHAGDIAATSVHRMLRRRLRIRRVREVDSDG